MSDSPRRDTAIVAWHEVPGTSVTPKEPSRRARCDWCRCAHRFDDWSDEFRMRKLKHFILYYFETISFHGKNFLVSEHSCVLAQRNVLGPES